MLAKQNMGGIAIIPKRAANAVHFIVALGAVLAFQSGAIGKVLPVKDDWGHVLLSRNFDWEAASETKLLAMFKRTDDLRCRDLKRAIQNAEAALKVAQTVDNSDFEKLARLDLDVLVSFAHGTNRQPSMVRLNSRKIDRAGRADLRLHAGLALLDLRTHSLDPKPHSDSILEYIEEAATACEDSDLKLRRCCAELYFRVFRLSESVEQESVQGLLESMKQFQPYESYPDALVIEKLIASQEAHERQDINARLIKVKEAELIAENLGNRDLTGKCIAFESVLSRKDTHPEARLSRLKRGVEVAMRLGSQDMIEQFLRAQSRVLKECGNREEAIEKMKLLKSLDLFENSSPFVRNASDHFIALQSEDMGHFAQAELSRSGLTQNDLVKRFDELQELADEIEEQRASSEKENFRKNQQLAAAEVKSDRDEAAVQFLKKYSLITTVIVLVAIPWLLVYLIRNHLNHVKGELEGEKVAAIEHQKNYNDLALRLQRLQRMESLGLMAGGVAHDFNNILVGVLGNAEIIRLKNDLGDKKFVLQRVDSIIKSAEKAAKLSKQMLAYAGKQIIAKQIVDMNSLVRECQSVLESVCLEGQTLVLELSTDPIYTKVDSTQIEQVFLNLITNAVEASSSNGVITIKSGKQIIGEVEDDPSLFGSRTTGGEMGFVEVLDSGSGVTHQELERIFEPFYSSSENMGRGLGLSVVYGAVEAHDGLIRCQSETGVGTSFKVLFPLESVEAFHNQLDAINVSEFHSIIGGEESLRGKKVLIIDDEKSVLETCHQLVSMCGCEVVTAIGGERGVEQVLTHKDDLACVILDVVMPEIGGNEVLGEMEKLKIDIPVVLMSGFSNLEIESFLERPNVLRVVQKPFRAAEIRQAVEDCLELSDLKKGTVELPTDALTAK